MERGGTACRRGSTTRGCSATPSAASWRRRRAGRSRPDSGRRPWWRASAICGSAPKRRQSANYLCTTHTNCIKYNCSYPDRILPVSLIEQRKRERKPAGLLFFFLPSVFFLYLRCRRWRTGWRKRPQSRMLHAGSGSDERTWRSGCSHPTDYSIPMNPPLLIRGDGRKNKIKHKQQSSLAGGQLARPSSFHDGWAKTGLQTADTNRLIFSTTPSGGAFSFLFFFFF